MMATAVATATATICRPGRGPDHGPEAASAGGATSMAAVPRHAALWLPPSVYLGASTGVVADMTTGLIYPAGHRQLARTCVPACPRARARAMARSLAPGIVVHSASPLRSNSLALSSRSRRTCDSSDAMAAFSRSFASYASRAAFSDCFAALAVSCEERFISTCSRYSALSRWDSSMEGYLRVFPRADRYEP